MQDTNRPDDHPSRERASGRVQVGRHARIQLSSVPLNSIRDHAQALKARDARLDLVRGTSPDLSQLTDEALDLLTCCCPAWVVERGTEKDRHHLVVAGGALLPALRLILEPAALIPVALVDAKFSDLRWLQVAAAHAAAAHLLASAQSDESLLEILNDAAEAGVGIFKDPSPAAHARVLALRKSPRRHGPGRPSKSSIT